jgi:hypothetical protein
MSHTIQNSSHPALSGVDGVAASNSDVILLIGRILLGWIFVRSGYGKIFDIPAYATTFPARGLPTFLAYICCPGGIFRRHRFDPRTCDPLRGAGDGCIYAGGNF